MFCVEVHRVDTGRLRAGSHRRERTPGVSSPLPGMAGDDPEGVGAVTPAGWLSTPHSVSVTQMRYELDSQFRLKHQQAQNRLPAVMRLRRFPRTGPGCFLTTSDPRSKTNRFPILRSARDRGVSSAGSHHHRHRRGAQQDRLLLPARHPSDAQDGSKLLYRNNIGLAGELRGNCGFCI